jgi:hypothetical protein
MGSRLGPARPPTQPPSIVMSGSLPAPASQPGARRRLRPLLVIALRVTQLDAGQLAVLVALAPAAVATEALIYRRFLPGMRSAGGACTTRSGVRAVLPVTGGQPRISSHEPTT